MLTKRSISACIGMLLMSTCWVFLWTQDTFWNPVLFFGMWSGATLLMYGFGEHGHPGPRRHLSLLLVSIPLWWWFEVVNARVQNWEYLLAAERYSKWEYGLMGSLAFSTVVPALDAACGLTVKLCHSVREPTIWNLWWYRTQTVVGFIFQILVFVWPTIFYPFVWIAPFLMVDGIMGHKGKGSLVADMVNLRWQPALGVAMGGILCGFLWEFWNFWSTPKWIYHIPLLDFGRVFEMPILGYGGYVPFAWGIYQLLRAWPVKPSTAPTLPIP